MERLYPRDAVKAEHVNCLICSATAAFIAVCGSNGGSSAVASGGGQLLMRPRRRSQTQNPFEISRLSNGDVVVNGGTWFGRGEGGTVGYAMRVCKAGGSEIAGVPYDAFVLPKTILSSPPSEITFFVNAETNRGVLTSPPWIYYAPTGGRETREAMRAARSGAFPALRVIGSIDENGKIFQVLHGAVWYKRSSSVPARGSFGISRKERTANVVHVCAGTIRFHNDFIRRNNGHSTVELAIDAQFCDDVSCGGTEAVFVPFYVVCERRLSQFSAPTYEIRFCDEPTTVGFSCRLCFCALNISLSMSTETMSFGLVDKTEILPFSASASGTAVFQLNVPKFKTCTVSVASSKLENIYFKKDVLFCAASEILIFGIAAKCALTMDTPTGAYYKEPVYVCCAGEIKCIGTTWTAMISSAVPHIACYNAEKGIGIKMCSFTRTICFVVGKISQAQTITLNTAFCAIEKKCISVPLSSATVSGSIPVSYKTLSFCSNQSEMLGYSTLSKVCFCFCEFSTHHSEIVSFAEEVYLPTLACSLAPLTSETRSIACASEFGETEIIVEEIKYRVKYSLSASEAFCNGTCGVPAADDFVSYPSADIPLPCLKSGESVYLVVGVGKSEKSSIFVICERALLTYRGAPRFIVAAAKNDVDWDNTYYSQSVPILPKNSPIGNLAYALDCRAVGDVVPIARVSLGSAGGYVIERTSSQPLYTAPTMLVLQRCDVMTRCSPTQIEKASAEETPIEFVPVALCVYKEGEE